MAAATGEVEVYDPPQRDGGDYIIQFRIKNGPLVRAIRSCGFRSNVAFAKACGVNVANLYAYLSLRRVPMKRNGAWQPSVLKMAATLHLPPESLFPEQHLEFALKRASGELEVTGEEIRALIVPHQDSAESGVIKEELHRALKECLETLPARQRLVLTHLYGLEDGRSKTLEEAGRIAGINATRERVRQLAVRGMKRLRSGPMVRKLVRAGYDGDTSADVLFPTCAGCQVLINDGREYRYNSQYWHRKCAESAWGRKITDEAAALLGGGEAR